MLLVRGLAVSAGGRRLVSGLDLDVGQGEAVAVRAPSGFGKTSLLRALALLDDARYARLELDGASPEALGVPRWRARVCFADGRTAGFADTVGEALARPFGFAAVEGGYDERVARALLGRLALPEDVLEREPGSLSAGELQRVCLVRALLIQPRVLLLDEPTSALDGGATEAVEALLRERVSEGLGVVVVSHDGPQAARLGARVLELTEYGDA